MGYAGGFQLVGTVRVLRTVRVKVQLPWQLTLRIEGRFRVLGSPPVLGSGRQEIGESLVHD